MEQTYVVLVDPMDNEIGLMEKNQAHYEGKLHRAVSVFIFNSQGEWLLQRRALHKYHSPGQWSNACCTHPLPGEAYSVAASRRMAEELGISPVITEKFRFIYEARLNNEMTEHELDVVFMGISDETPTPNPEEVDQFRFLDTETLLHEISEYPERFTPWFKKLVLRAEEIASPALSSKTCE